MHISRRDFLWKMAAGGMALPFIEDMSRTFAFAQGPGGDTLPPLPRPHPGQLAWQQAELVAMYHYDLHLFDAPGQPHVRYDQAKNRLRVFPNTDAFAPTELDMEQWVQSAVDMGAKAAVMTSCHENGLRLWQSDANPYSLKTTKWGGGKRDLVDEFAKACRKRGIRPGFFHCQRWNSLLRVHDFRVTKECPLSQEEYGRMLEKEVEELCTRYGELFMLWFDGGALTPEQGGPDMVPLFEKHQPQGIFYHSDQRRDLRWARTEQGVAPYPCWSSVDKTQLRTGERGAPPPAGGDPFGSDFCPVLADTPLRGKGGHEWFWEPDDERLIFPLPDLMRMYEQSVGRNATLVIGLTPDKRGLLPGADVARIKEFGNAIRRQFGKPLAQVSGRGCTHLLKLRGNPKVSHAVFGEETRDGERIRRYTLEAETPQGWIPLSAGESVGHKRIERFKPVAASALRLNIPHAAGEPVLREFSAHEGWNLSENGSTAGHGLPWDSPRRPKQA